MHQFKPILTLLIVAVCAARGWAAEPKQWAQDNLADLVALYKEFHQMPELSFQEEKTAARLAKELRKAGFEVTENVGGYGVVGLLENGAGPTLMLRTDLDALPVVEQTGLPYASKVTVTDKRGATVGTMHACGHDIHITNLIGVARYMATHKDRWQGTLMMIGQPAEERGAGAKAMLADGLFRRFPRPDYAMALHVDSTAAAGTVGYRFGYALANVDSVDITVKGAGGHGAYPHTTIDPIVTAARLVLDLQTIVSREIKPIEPAVITVGSIHGGTKHNIIGNTCHLQITVRSYSQKVRRQLIDAIERKARAAAASAAAPEPEVDVSEGTPSLLNDQELGQRAVSVFREVLGEENVREAEPSMGGEDFSRYGQAGVPIFMYRLGSVAPERMAKYEKDQQQPPSLHSPLYYPDPEPTLATGVSTMASVALKILQPKSN